MGDKNGTESKKLTSSEDARKPKPRGLASVRSRSGGGGSPAWEFMLPGQTYGDIILEKPASDPKEPSPNRKRAEHRETSAVSNKKQSTGRTSKSESKGAETHRK